MSKKVCAGDGSDGGQDEEVGERARFATVMKINGEVGWQKWR